MSKSVVLTRDNWREATRDLPAMVGRAMSFCLGLERGVLKFRTGGKVFVIQGRKDGREAEMVIHDFNMAKRVLGRGQVGIAESYIAGEWSSPDLTQFLQLFCENWRIISTFVRDKPIARALMRVRHWLNRNTRRGSRRNILAHYDLGNDFYGLWLDPSMTYSSAMFGEGSEPDLTEAQMRKYQALSERLSLSDQDDVVEIGCGWGGFAEFAAKEIGCHVTGITISEEQHAYASKRIAAAGLNEKVEIRLQDYRDLDGRFDKIASIEMFEAVGEEYWPTYFSKLENCLKLGGRAGLQVITIQDSMFGTYRMFNPDFIQRYIFPGGMLPCPSVLQDVSENAGLKITDEHIFGLDYARTLARWRNSFFAAWPEITKLGFDERFRRIWEYYLCYCEAGFRSGNVDVRQMVFTR
ncbi:MAG: cyclopropane-fatty-acyl-phospholipid synthase family protein [Hyphomicrobiales bacterium]|nr:cyclopropane-fatty-acyl-phospholipid synthase family protein [Hyphomicrobiales bacterium]